MHVQTISESIPFVSQPAVCGVRGVVLEALGRFEEAVRDYHSVLDVQPNDPAAWNNLGNATRGLGLWQVTSFSVPVSAKLCLTPPSSSSLSLWMRRQRAKFGRKGGTGRGDLSTFLGR